MVKRKKRKTRKTGKKSPTFPFSELQVLLPGNKVKDLRKVEDDRRERNQKKEGKLKA